MNITLIRNLDHKGRIMIPAEVRRVMNVSAGDPVEFSTYKEHLLLRKFEYLGDSEIEEHLDILFKTIRCSIAAVSGIHVIASKGISIPPGTTITAELEHYTQLREYVLLDEEVSATAYQNHPVDTIIPLGHGLSLLLFRKKAGHVTDSERIAAELIARLLARKEYCSTQ